MRTGERRQHRRAIDVDRHGEALAEDLSQHVTRDGRAPHATEDHRGHAVQVGEPLGPQACLVRRARMVGERSDDAQHVRGVDLAERRFVVEVDQRPVPGFSASSMSITGIPSRTG